MTAPDSALAGGEEGTLCEVDRTGFSRMGCTPDVQFGMVDHELDTGLIAEVDAAALAASGAPLELNALLLAAGTRIVAVRMQIPETHSCCVEAGERLGEKDPLSRVRRSRCYMSAAEDAALASALASDVVEAADLVQQTARSMLAKVNGNPGA